MVNKSFRKTNIKNFHVIQRELNCSMCKSGHHLYKCPKFLELSLELKRKFVKEQNLCFNCFSNSHKSKTCTSAYTCRTCKRRHHTLVHMSHLSRSDSKINIVQPIVKTTSNFDQAPKTVVNHTLTHSNLYTILPTAIVQVKDSFKNTQTCRVLLDSGSMTSLISEKCVNRLGLKRQNAKYPVSGLNSSKSNYTRGITFLQLSSIYNSHFVNIRPFILNYLTSNLPTFNIERSKFLSKLPENLADQHFYKQTEIDIILGADILFDIWIPGSRIYLGNTSLSAFESIFGWVVAGSFCSENNTYQPRIHSFHTTIDNEFDLQKFWSIEELPQKSILTDSERLAEEHFQKTTTRNFDGRYIVRLPFKTSPPTSLNETQQIAINRFHYTEKKLSNNIQLKSEYSKFIGEYIDLQHMEEVKQNDLNTISNFSYFPHHAVFKEDSITTKLRVVFDASVKTSENNSSNGELLTGPTLQRDLFSICLCARKHQFIFSAEIEKMFRQILVHPDDQHFQRIVWRDSPDKPIRHYKLNTVTYGTACATYLAVKVLQLVVLDHQQTHPFAANVILNDFYVDDVITGAETSDALISIQKQLIEVLKLGGFNLRKFLSNSPALLNSIPDNLKENSPLELTDETSKKLLGLQWCPDNDSSSYKVNLPQSTICTKRQILSEMSRIFDPLGLLSPSISMIKILLQEIWLQNYNWDETISSTIADKWKLIKQQLESFHELQIDRKLFPLPSTQEFHGFCEASERAYSAVIYCVSKSPNGCIDSKIVCAKSKIASLNPISLPRLELQGALLLTRLFVNCIEALKLKDYKIFAHTDFQIVLAWLSSHPRRWKTFVANRVAEILETLPRSIWHHVSSSDNPTDLNSPGMLPQDLLVSKIWWNGPSFLKLEKHHSSYTSYKLSAVENSALEREKRAIEQIEVHVATSTLKSDDSILQFLNNCSSWSKMYRVIAYCIRFISNCKTSSRNKSYLNIAEIERANYDDDQNSALTPGHFLIGQPLVAIPKPSITDRKISLLTNWQLLQNLSQRFWKSWSNDYLTSLQQRPKWSSKTTNLKQDDIVVLKDNTTPPATWLIGRVIECYPSKDNQVRVVKVQTTKGVYIRPAVKVVPLPNAEES